MSSCNDYPVNNIDAQDIPTWGKNVLPEDGYLLMAAVQKDRQCGRDLPFLYHLPLHMITPGGTFQANTYSANGNGFDGNWPVNQVRAGFVYNNTPNDIRYAANSTTYQRAQFIIVKRDETISGNYIVMASGAYTFQGGHSYVPGYSYYLGANGEPTTDGAYKNGVRQHLFDVIDRSTILVNVYEEKE